MAFAQRREERVSQESGARACDFTRQVVEALKQATIIYALHAG